MTDEEMKAMPIPQLQEDGGLLFLWVTGRAVSLKVQLLANVAWHARLIPPLFQLQTELGRDCLKVWG